jgi:hypothetical protein
MFLTSSQCVSRNVPNSTTPFSHIFCPKLNEKKLAFSFPSTVIPKLCSSARTLLFFVPRTPFVFRNAVLLRSRNSVRLQERCFPSFAELCSSSGTLFSFVRGTLFVLRTLFSFVRGTLFVLRNAVFLRSPNSVRPQELCVLRNALLSFVRWRIRRNHLQGTRCLHCGGRRTQFRLRASVRILQAQREGDNKRRPTEDHTEDKQTDIKHTRGRASS